jgi:predicted dehydrogenase
MALLNTIQKLRAQGHIAQVTSVCDAWVQRRTMGEARSGGTIEKDWRALVARKDLDGVMIATPDHLHAPMTLAALESGKDVYCESPATRTLEEAAAIRDAARGSGRMYQVGARGVTQNQWRAARTLIDSGRLGTPSISQATIQPSPLFTETLTVSPSEVRWADFLGDQEDPPFELNCFVQWRMFSPFSDGPMAAAQFDAIAAFHVATGSASALRVAATGGRFNDGPGDNPDRMVMRVEYPNGHRLVLDALEASPETRPPITRLEHAAIEYRGDHLSVTPQGSNTEPFTQEFGLEGTAVIETQPSAGPLTNWLECIETREPCVCNEDLAYKAMATLATGMRSLREQKALDLSRTHL